MKLLPCPKKRSGTGVILALFPPRSQDLQCCHPTSPGNCGDMMTSPQLLPAGREGARWEKPPMVAVITAIVRASLSLFRGCCPSPMFLKWGMWREKPLTVAAIACLPLFLLHFKNSEKNAVSQPHLLDRYRAPCRRFFSSPASSFSTFF